MKHIISQYDNARQHAPGLPHLDVNIVWTDNCPTQYKCRQNFFNISHFSSNFIRPTRIVHKFAQKFRFKGSWDAVGKVVKMRIENNELKYVRVADAWDCYRTLRKQLSKDGSEKLILGLEQHEIDGDERVLKNTTFTTKRTLIGYVTEDVDEFNARSAEQQYDHIVFSDRSETLASKMKPVVDTLALSQVQGEVESSTGTGARTLITSYLPCSCLVCRTDPSDVLRCSYADVRRSKHQDIKMTTVRNESCIDDPLGLNAMNIQELKEQITGRGIYVPSSIRKTDLIEILKDILDEECSNEDAN